MPYIRVGIYSIEHVKKDVMDFRKGILPPSYRFDGYKVNLSSDRYHLFFKKGIECVSCGIKGLYFALERLVNNRAFKEYKKREFQDFLEWEKKYKRSLGKSSYGNVSKYHFNLYALDEDGNEVLMTKDHITPKSKGGRNHISNYQTMCCECNLKKGNKKIGSHK